MGGEIFFLQNLGGDNRVVGGESGGHHPLNFQFLGPHVDMGGGGRGVVTP